MRMVRLRRERGVSRIGAALRSFEKSLISRCSEEEGEMIVFGIIIP